MLKKVSLIRTNNIFWEGKNEKENFSVFGGYRCTAGGCL